MFISDYYQESKEKIRKEILNEENKEHLNVDFYFGKYSLNPIIFDETKKEIIGEPENDKRLLRDPFDRGTFECIFKVIKVEMPIFLNKKINIISELQSSVYSLGGYENDFSFYPDKIVFCLDVAKGNQFYNKDDVSKNKSSIKKELETIISRKNDDINKGNEDLKKFIVNLIEKKVEDLENFDKNWKFLSEKLKQEN